MYPTSPPHDAAAQARLTHILRERDRLGLLSDDEKALRHEWRNYVTDVYLGSGSMAGEDLTQRDLTGNVPQLVLDNVSFVKLKDFVSQASPSSELKDDLFGCSSRFDVFCVAKKHSIALDALLLELDSARSPKSAIVTPTAADLAGFGCSAAVAHAEKAALEKAIAAHHAPPQAGEAQRTAADADITDSLSLRDRESQAMPILCQEREPAAAVAVAPLQQALADSEVQAAFAEPETALQQAFADTEVQAAFSL